MMARRGGGEDVKEWSVVVEVVAVLDETDSPSPGDVQMLGLVGIEAIVEERDTPQNEGQTCAD